MALDPEELRKRRLERDTHRKTQRAKKRKLLFRLVIAAVVLIACGVLIFVTGRQDPASPAETKTPDAAAASLQDTTPPVETTLPATTTIHLAFGGDLNVTDNTVNAGGTEYDFTETFMDVAHLFADADIAALNFEGTLCGAPYGGESKSAPQSMMEALSRIGVDYIQLANSYSIYKGTSGLGTTIDSVRAAGMEPLGVYADESAFQAGKGYSIYEAQGIKVAFVAFTKGMDGMTLPAGSENCVNLLYSDYDSTYQDVDKKRITSVLQDVSKENPDVVIAMLHWGSEYNDTISRSQKEITKLLQKNGVDAIIGTHSHYVQQMEFDRANGNFVAYSLGDFWGDASRSGSEYSVILDLEVTRDNTTGNTKISGYSYTPIYTVVDPSKNTRRVVRIEETRKAYEENYIDKVSKTTYDSMVYAQKRIQARVIGE